MKRYLLFVLLPAVVAGCATHPVAIEDADPVPADRVFAPLAVSDAPAGRLLIVRDRGTMVGGCPMALYVDGVLVAHIRSGEHIAWPTGAGKHIVGVGPAGKGACAFKDAAANLRELGVELPAGGQVKLRAGVTQDAVYQIAPTAF